MSTSNSTTFSPTYASNAFYFQANSSSTALTYFLFAFGWVVAVGCCCVYFLCGHRLRRQRRVLLGAANRAGGGNEGANTPPALTNEQKNLLGEVEYHSAMATSMENLEEHWNIKDCSICLSSFAEGEVCRSLPAPCGHMFHKSCIDQWFDKSSRCPLCNRSVHSLLEGIQRIEGDNDDGADAREEEKEPREPRNPLEADDVEIGRNPRVLEEEKENGEGVRLQN